MPKQKILHITQATGGVKTYVAHVLEYADPEQFEFAIIAPADDYFESFCRRRAVPYYTIDLERGNNPLKNTAVLSQIIRAIKKEKPAIIHAHSAKGGFLGRLAAKLTKTMVIYTPHAFSFMSFTGGKRMAFFMLEIIARSWTTLLLAISYSEASRAVNEVGLPPEKVKTILNAVPVHKPAVHKEQPGPLKIRMIGRLTHQKNPLLFLEVAHRLLSGYENLEFAILGAGIHDHLTDEIDAFLIKNKLQDKVKIEQWGNVSTGQTFLQETDIYVMTSIFEGLPFSLLEAMLAGIPCVVTRVDGNTDVIQNNENGFSCLSVEEFCKKLELLINNEALRQRIGQAGRDYVIAHHDIQKNIKQLEAIYQGL
ncbi:glycosyltransferase family 4 protein [Mucilaginibacter sp.]